ncbi:MAG: hypothetical protein H0U72_11255 [Nitrosospira sp.]|nr:hypothetical protein [Nitrosospira sp.]
MEWVSKPPFDISNASLLEGSFTRHCVPQLSLIYFEPIFSKPRFEDIFGAWKEDLDRSEKGNFKNTAISPDHIKAAAHLTYWIRREAPIIDLITLREYVATPGSGSQYDEHETIKIERGLRDIPDTIVLPDPEVIVATLDNGMTMKEFMEDREKAVVYGNELFAFSFGFHLAKAYEEQKRKELGLISKSIAWPSGAYIDDLCYFLKFKNVSPHSLDLIYRALLKISD